MAIPGRRNEAGQSLAEFALVIPVFLVLVLGMFDFGRVVWANSALSNAAREGARYAIVRGGSPTSRCPVGPPSGIVVIPGATSSCPYPSPSKQGIVTTVLEHAIAAGSNVRVDVCYGSSCAGSTDAPGASNARGTPVTVSASSTVQLTAASLLGLSSVEVNARSTMIVSH